MLGGGPHSRCLERSARAMPRRPRPVFVELANFHSHFTFQCPRSFYRNTPPNDDLRCAAGYPANPSIHSSSHNQIVPRYKVAKRRHLERVLGSPQDARRLSAMNNEKHFIYHFFRLFIGSINFDGVGEGSRLL